MEKLEVKNVSVSFDGKQVLEDVTIELNRCELVCLLGVSGGGKTTLFNVISGLLRPDAGQVLLDGGDITGRPGSISYMLQKDLLLPYRTIEDNVALPDAMHGFTSSSALIGCIIGSAISGYMASNFGRKKSLIFAGICFFLSALGSYNPEFLFFEYGKPSYDLLVAFNLYRVLGGVGVGLASAICPMYIAEVAPSNIRGTLVSWNQFAIIFGQLLVYFVNFLILGEHTNPIIEKTAQGVYNVVAGSDPWTVETGWRYMFGSEAVPAGLFALLICFVPETPRYLAMCGQDNKALHVLTRINGVERAKTILQEIKATAEEKTERLFTYGWVVIFVGIMLSVFQQAVGINAVLYFCSTYFRIHEYG